MRLIVSLLAIVAALTLLPMPMAAVAQEPGAADPCEGSTTPEINTCYGNKLQAAEEVMNRYLHAATLRYAESGDDGIILGLTESQRAFEAYRDIECGAVHYRWRDGTIRTVMGLICRIALTDQRTHTIWRTWLTYPDGTQPTLPEPSPTE